jgi:hypothetical protein
MIALAECPDGYGYPGFLDWFRYNSLGEFERGLRANYDIYGQTAYATYEKASAVNIALVSRLDPQEVERMKMHPAGSFAQAYALAAENLGDHFRAYALPASSASLFQTGAEHREACASVAKYKDCDERQKQASQARNQ